MSLNLHNGICYYGKMISFYWISPQNVKTDGRHWQLIRTCNDIRSWYYWCCSGRKRQFTIVEHYIHVSIASSRHHWAWLSNWGFCIACWRIRILNTYRSVYTIIQWWKSLAAIHFIQLLNIVVHIHCRSLSHLQRPCNNKDIKQQLLPNANGQFRKMNAINRLTKLTWIQLGRAAHICGRELCLIYGKYC